MFHFVLVLLLDPIFFCLSGSVVGREGLHLSRDCVAIAGGHPELQK